MDIDSKFLVNVKSSTSPVDSKFTETKQTKSNIGIDSKFLAAPKSGGTISTDLQKKKTKEEDGFIENMSPIDPPEVNNAYSFAFGLGLKDTYRGVKQIAGLDKAQMKANQQKLNELMRGPNGGYVMAAYFAGAILDPAGWLIPFGKAKNLASMARMGMVSGAIAGATGYVDEESFIDSRGKQAILGAVGGGVISPAMGAIKNVGVMVTGKGNMIPLTRKLTKQEMINRGASTVQISGASTTGKAVDKDTGIVKPLKTTGPDEVLVRTTADIQDEGKSVIDGIFEMFKKKNDKLPFPNVKALHDIPKPTSRGPKYFLSRLFNSYQRNYEKHVGKRLLKTIKTGEGGTAFAGGAIGFTTDTIEGDYQAPSLAQRFTQAFAGAALGYGGIKFFKSKTAKELGFVKRTKLGAAGEEVEFVETYPELFARWFVDRAGLPDNYRKIQIDAQGLEYSLAGQMVKMAKLVEKLTPDENALLYNILSGDVAVKGTERTIVRLAAKTRGMIKRMSQTYIDLGLLSKETVKLNEGKYLMRIYKDLEKVKDELGQAKGPVNIGYKKIGDELRGRGFFRDYTVKEYLETQRFTKNVIDEVVDKNHRGWDLPEDVVLKNNKLYKVGEDGSETLLKNNDMVTLRWEYSKPERKWMGEVENAAIAIEYTGLVQARTIAKFSFYADVAAKFGKTKKEIEGLDEPYLMIPKSKIEGKNIPKYGKLAGKYVPESIWKDIAGMQKYQDISSNALYSQYKKLNSLWKVSKTAWNPTVHVNNIFGNVILSDLADVPLSGLADAWKALRANADGSGYKSDIVELAKRMGVMDADFIQQESKRFRFEDMEKIYSIKGQQSEWNSSVGIATNIYRKIVKGIKENKITGTLEDWYRIEDHVFRLNAFMHRIKLGDSYEDAALFARKQFIDYDIDAPAINHLRNTVTPFLSFTYRMIPILAETAVMRPTKFAKYAALGYALTNLEGYVGGEEAKVERALLPDYEAGNIMDLPFMPKKVIRIPMKDQNGRPKFVNISRLFPGGDVLSFDGKKAVPFLPEPLQPSFGVVGDAVQSAIGYDLFRGEKDIRRGDGGPIEETMEALDMFVRKLIPNFPYVPGSYSTKRLERALKQEQSPYRVPQSEAEALLNSFGIKISNKSIATLARSKKIEFDRDIRKQKRKISNIAKDFSNGSIDEDEYIKKVGKVMEKINKIQMTYFGRLAGVDPYGFRWFDKLSDGEEK